MDQHNCPSNKQFQENNNRGNHIVDLLKHMSDYRNRQRDILSQLDSSIFVTDNIPR